MSITIREATIDDVNIGLLNIFIEGFRHHQINRPDIFADLSDEELKKDLIKNFENLSTIVILDDNNIVGYISYKIKENRTKKLHVDQLAITEKHRGRGLGKKLVDEIKKIAKNNNCDRIELDCWTFNKNALAMYEHIGFEKQRIVYEFKL